MKQANRNKLLKYASLLFSTIVGVTFIVSGFLKAVDPWGTAIKFEEYFSVYGFDWLMPLSDVLAIWLCGAEMMMGLMMLFKVRLRLISIFALLSMSVFTVITLLSATVLPVVDCGCFGEAITLTSWQTFYKNLVILPMVITIWYRYRPDRIFAFNRREIILTVLFCVTTIGFSLYNYIHLPMIDFLPYKVGVNLLQVDNESIAKSKVVLVYRNIESGELREFTLNDSMTWPDESQWEWVETRDVESVEPVGHKLHISDFKLRDLDQNDVTKSLLESHKTLHLLCITSFDKMQESCKKRIEKYIAECKARAEHVVIITTDSFSEQSYNAQCGLSVDMYNIEGEILKALIRANDGVVVLRSGVIVDKISCFDM